MIRLEVKGVENVIKNFELADKASVEGIHRAIEVGANRIRDYAKNVVPVKTGRLKGSIQVRSLRKTKTGASAEIAPKTEYDIFVEFGTYKMGARPYMRPAAFAIFPEIASMIEKEIRK